MASRRISVCNPDSPFYTGEKNSLDLSTFEKASTDITAFESAMKEILHGVDLEDVEVENDSKERALQNIRQELYIEKNNIFRRLSTTPLKHIGHTNVSIDDMLVASTISSSSSSSNDSKTEKNSTSNNNKKNSPSKSKLSKNSSLLVPTAANVASSKALEDRKRLKNEEIKANEDYIRRMRSPIIQDKTKTVPISDSLLRPNQSMIHSMNVLDEKRASPDSRIAPKVKTDEYDGIIYYNEARKKNTIYNNKSSYSPSKTVKISDRLLQRTISQESQIKAFIQMKSEITDEMDPWWELRKSKTDITANVDVGYSKALENAKSKLHNHTSASRVQEYQKPKVKTLQPENISKINNNSRLLNNTLTSKPVESKKKKIINNNNNNDSNNNSSSKKSNTSSGNKKKKDAVAQSTSVPLSTSSSSPLMDGGPSILLNSLFRNIDAESISSTNASPQSSLGNSNNLDTTESNSNSPMTNINDVKNKTVDNSDSNNNDNHNHNHNNSKSLSKIESEQMTTVPLSSSSSSSSSSIFRHDSISKTYNEDKSTVFTMPQKKASKSTTKTTTTKKGSVHNMNNTSNGTSAGKPVIRGRKSIAIVEPPKPTGPPMELDPMLAVSLTEDNDDQDGETWEEV